MKLIIRRKNGALKPQGLLCQKFSIFLQHGRKAAKISIDCPDPKETCNKSTKSHVHFLVRHSALQNHFKMLGFFVNL